MFSNFNGLSLSQWFRCYEIQLENKKSTKYVDYLCHITNLPTVGAIKIPKKQNSHINCFEIKIFSMKNGTALCVSKDKSCSDQEVLEFQTDNNWIN